MTNTVYIIAAKRSAIGSYLGALKDVSPASLGATVIKDILNTLPIDPHTVDEVIVGNVLSAGQGQGLARQVSIHGGLPHTVPAYAVNMVCGSGLKSVMNGYHSIQSGIHSLILAGGVESMSQAPYLVPASTRSGHKMGNLTMVDHMVHDALTDAFENIHMGVTAENIASLYGISREAQDQFAMHSQEKAIHAVDTNVFQSEITPITVHQRKEDVVVDRDEYPNRTTSLEKLAKLRPAFVKAGTVTAGNASGLNDGASFVCLANQDVVNKMGITPYAKIIAMAQSGVNPNVMGLGPTPAIIKALEMAGLTLEDMDLMELNEAFAAQSLGVIHELSQHYSLDEKTLLNKTNVNGGAIALGHPVGASGNRILVTLVHALKRTNKRYGLAALCIGGGMGIAIVIECI